MDLAESIKQEAIEIGFDLAGITGAEPIDDEQIDYLRKWLDRGCAARMRYMHRNFEKRTSPAKLLPTAKSVICVGLNYRPAKMTSNEAPCGLARIANFALYEDYHPFIKDRLYRLVDFISKRIGRDDWKFKVCVDSAPLAERALAQRAGLGFIGRNHMLINPEFGLQILLGEIVTDLELACDEPVLSRCSDCCRCVRACPTGALGFDGSFDAGRCISYLTIEHKGEIDYPIAEKIGPRLFGCDECILACPHEINAKPCANKEFRFFAERLRIEPATILKWNSAQFDKNLACSPLQRLGLAGLKRNANICLIK